MQLMNIAAGTYDSESLPFSAQRCINWFPIVADSAALAQTALLASSGIKVFTELPAGICRGSHFSNGLSYWVYGERLYSVDVNGSFSDLGAIDGSSRLSIASNDRYIVFVSLDSGSYVYDTQESALTEITDPDFIKSKTVVFKDGFFVFSAADGSVFFHSDANDPFSYDALNFGTAEINPDKIVALHVNHNELYVIGEETIEIFQTVGGVGFVFQRVNGANIQKGAFSQYSIQEFDNTFTFVGGGLNEKAAIWRVTSSSSASKISTSSIDYQIQLFNEEEISNCFSMVWAERGSFFVSFTFISARIPSKTFVFDATSSARSQALVWHERQTGVNDSHWRANSTLKAYGNILVGDDRSGNIGVLSQSNYEEYQEVIYRRRDTQPFSNRLDAQRFGTLELAMSAGTGMENNTTPYIRMSYSDDGARTFSSEFRRSFGKVGRYNTKPQWRRQGRISRDRVLRFETTANVECDIFSLGVDLSVGR